MNHLFLSGNEIPIVIKKLFLSFAHLLFLKINKQILSVAGMKESDVIYKGEWHLLSSYWRLVTRKFPLKTVNDIIVDDISCRLRVIIGYLIVVT